MDGKIRLTSLRPVLRTSSRKKNAVMIDKQVIMEDTKHGRKKGCPDRVVSVGLTE